MLKKDELVGAIVYYDGQHNDARMNISLAFTAAHMGANIANHCAVTELIHENKVIRGVKCVDRYRSENFEKKKRGLRIYFFCRQRICNSN